MINFVDILSGLSARGYDYSPDAAVLADLHELVDHRFVSSLRRLFDRPDHIVANVSVCFMPLKDMSHLYRYGYAIPFDTGLVPSVLSLCDGMKVRAFLVVFTFESKRHRSWTAVAAVMLPNLQWYRGRRTSKADTSIYITIIISSRVIQWRMV